MQAVLPLLHARLLVICLDIDTTVLTGVPGCMSAPIISLPPPPLPPTKRMEIRCIDTLYLLV